MPRKTYKLVDGVKHYKCKVCKKWKPEDDLSHNKMCYTCGIPKVREAADQLIARKGPYYERWKARMKSAIEEM